MKSDSESSAKDADYIASSDFADVPPLVKGNHNYEYTLDPSASAFAGTTVSPNYGSKVTNSDTCFQSKKETKKGAVVGLDDEYEPFDYSKLHCEDPEITFFATLTTYLSYAIIIFFGHLRDFFGKRTKRSRYFSEKEMVIEKGFAPIVKVAENFYTRRLYHRIQDCWNRPITSEPGSVIDVVVRKSADGNKTLRWSTNESSSNVEVETKRCINLGSYNYLGFGDDWKNTCKDYVWEVFDDFPINTLSS